MFSELREKGQAMAAKFEVYKSGENYRWRLKAGNGEIVASGACCQMPPTRRVPG